jgi:hypothetical protein
MNHGIDFVSPKGRFARSVNVERDTGANSIESYLPTGRALDVISRVARCLDDQPRTRAFSITGPYGTGKSSLAVFLDALLGPANDPATEVALAVLRAVDPSDAELIESSKAALGPNGFVRAVVTATKEPVAATLTRAVLHGMQRFSGQSRKGAWKAALASVEQAVKAFDSEDAVLPSNRFIRDLLQAVAEIAPVLIVIDEFGKNLEAFADSRSEADLYLLQELVEWSHAPGEGGCPVITVTMQHLAFEEYLDSVTQSLRREWAKVQGRFEDIPYLDTPSQTRHLIAQVLEEPTDARFTKKRKLWAQECHNAARLVGLSHELDQSLVEQAWPLHPTSLLVLPELCARYGQNERTLFSFLASSEPLGVPAWLVSEPVGARVKDIRLDRIYDYFVESAATSAATSQTASRWVEVETAVRDATGLTEGERRVLKAVGLLNLVSAGGAVRASRAVLQLACADGRSGTETSDDVDAALAGLEASGRVTYREFADEFRLWRGSDLDLRSAIESARRRLRQEPAEVLLSRTREMLPVVAARHSTVTGTLRVFHRIWDSDGSVEVLPPTNGADGLLVYAVGPKVPRVDVGASDGRPIVAVRPRNDEELLESALELAAVRAVLQDDGVVGDDWVARRELAEREAEALTTFDAAFEAAVGHRSDGAKWWLLTTEDGKPQALPSPTSVTAALSEVCDRSYADSPPVANEMLNRHELTSQGAKARRLLIEGLLKSIDRERFDIEGFPPERAMYDAVFGATGIHREANGAWEIGAPTLPSWIPVWNAMTRIFDRSKGKRVDLGRALVELASPPIGLKAGVGPVLLVAGIVAHRSELALYEHGTYRPRLTPDIAERLLRNPAHFEIKHFAATSGPRLAAVRVLAERLGVHSWRGAPPTVLSIVAHLVGQINGLTEYGKQTRNLPPETIAIRRALLDATEPDVILFETLPELFDLPPLGASSRQRQVRDVDAYAADLADGLEQALGDLRGIHSRLLDEIEQELAAATRSDREGLRAELADRGARIRGKVLDVRLRALLAAVSDDQKDRDGWLEYVAMTVAGPPATWDDDDRLRFLGTVKELGGTFRRIEVLHFERLADDGEPFEASRHTFTKPDGTERARVVSSDERVRARLGTRLDELLTTLTEELDGDAEAALDTLLAGIADRVFADPIDELSHPRRTVESNQAPARSRKATKT